MNHLEQTGPELPSAGDDPRVTNAVKEYQALVEAGARPDRASFLTRHPDIASELARCLAGLELVNAVAAELRGPDDRPPEIDPALPLGDFRIIREVGRGGMGIVYEAEQLSLGRRVALKVLPFAASLDPRQLQRFKNEAQAVAHLHHTNIVPVYAIGCDRGVHYFAMQFIDGHTLAALIEDLRCPKAQQSPPAATDVTTAHTPETATLAPNATVDPSSSSHRTAAFIRTAAQLALHAAEALEHAHQMGVVHRDIKPANLLIDVRGNLWITDFGLARFQVDAGLTATGDLIGTLRYMSPEQALGGASPVDHRTDVYSLGATLYELLTLQYASGGQDRQQLLQQIASVEPRPPRKLNPAIPADLETIVLKAMAKSPQERYASAKELADDLRRWLEDRPIRARRPSLLQVASKFLRRHRAVVRTAVCVAFVALAVAIGLIWQEKNRTAEQKTNAEVEKTIAQQQRDRATSNLDSSLAILSKLLEVVENQATRGLSLRQEDQRLLNDSLGFYEGFNRTNRDTPAALAELIQANGKIGNIQRLLGQNTRAVKSYRRAIELSEQLAAADRDNLAHQANLLVALGRLGEVHRELNQRDEAEKLYQRCLKIGSHLLEQAPENPDYLSAVSNLRHHQARLRDDQERRLEASALLHQAIADQREALRQRPGDTGFRESLATSTSYLGTILRKLGKLEQAAQVYDRALSLTARLLADYPQQTRYRQQLARVYNNRATLRTDQKKPADAEQDVRRALAEMRPLMRDFPTVPAYRQQLAAGMHNLGLILMSAGRPAAAVPVFCEAVELRQRLAADYPDAVPAVVTAYRDAVTDSSNKLDEALKAIRQPREASEAYRNTLATVGQFWNRFPEIANGRVRVAQWHLLLAIQLEQAALLTGTDAERAEQLAEAVKQHVTAQGLFNALIKKFPLELPYPRDKAGSLAHLGAVYNQMGRITDSADSYLSAAHLYQRLAKADPREPTYPQACGACSLARAQQLLKLGQREAEEAFTTARDLCRSLIQKFGPRPAYRRLLGQTLFGLGKLFEETGRGADALKSYRAARTIQEDLLAKTLDPLHALDLANTHTNVGVLYSNVLRQHRKAVAAFEEGRKLRKSVWKTTRKDKEYQYFVANSWMNLAGAYLADDNIAAAENAYTEALVVQKPLGTAADARPTDRQQLGWILKGLADLYRQSKRPAKAEETCLQALAIFRVLVRERKGQISYVEDLANTLVSMGMACDVGGKAEESLTWYRRASEQAKAILVETPKHQAAREFLRMAHLLRALLLTNLGRHAESLPDWDTALEMAHPGERDRMAMDRIWSLAHAGDHHRATLESAAKAAGKPAPIVLMQAVRIHAHCSEIARKDGRLSAEDQKKRCEQYIARALELLNRAKAAGLLKDAEDVKFLRNDPELAPLRALPEFKKLFD